MQTLLASNYFPNIRYFSKLFIHENISIDLYENFPKQTYRNRCNILSANGLLPLVVPVLKGRSGKIITKDIKISYSEKWQHQHIKSIMSAYSSAPFYDFYIDEIKNLIEKKHIYLIDLNSEILKYFLNTLNIKCNIKHTNDFISLSVNNYNDFRFSISPKNKISDKNFYSNEYIQVFSDRFEFLNNLSILDLIFNLGPESRTYLIKCTKKQ